MPCCRRCRRPMRCAPRRPRTPSSSSSRRSFPEPKMSEWLSAQDTAKQIAQGELTAERALDTYLTRIGNLDGQLASFLAVDSTGARAAAVEIDRKRKAGEPLGPLAGVPSALKDVLVTKDLETPAASKILEGWKPPYAGTAVAKLRA